MDDDFIMKKLLAIFLLLFAVKLALSISDQLDNVVVYRKVMPTHTEESLAHYPVEINTYNSIGKEQKIIIKSRPHRVVVDEVNTLETLLTLDVGDSIIATAVSENSVSYKRLQEKYSKELTRIQYNYKNGFSQESVIASEPDFIIGWKSTFTPTRLRTTSWWNERGFNTYIVSTSNHVMSRGTIEDECNFILDMGKIFDREEKADSIVQQIQESLKIEERSLKKQAVQTVAVVELRGRMLANYDDGWIVGDMVRKMGGSMPITAKTISYEDLIYYNPDVIYVVYFNEANKQQIVKMFSEAKFSSLKAVKQNRVLLLPFYCMYTPAVRTLEGIKIIKAGLYPELKDT